MRSNTSRGRQEEVRKHFTERNSEWIQHEPLSPIMITVILVPIYKMLQGGKKLYIKPNFMRHKHEINLNFL